MIRAEYGLMETYRFPLNFPEVVKELNIQLTHRQPMHFGLGCRGITPSLTI